MTFGTVRCDEATFSGSIVTTRVKGGEASGVLAGLPKKLSRVLVRAVTVAGEELEEEMSIEHY